MRIARPLFLVTTPLGIVLGLREAWGIRPALAVLMAVLMGVIGAFYFLTWRVYRSERDASHSQSAPHGK